MKHSWQKELSQAIQTIEELEQSCTLTSEERAWKDFAASHDAESILRVRIPRSYFDLIDQSAGRDDPIRRQVVPTVEEMHELPEESGDPLAEDAYTIAPRLIRRYKSRAVFLATDMCAVYCRHCFRRRFAGKEVGPAAIAEIEQAAKVLRHQPEIKELLISGGDPLTMTDSQIEMMLSLFHENRPDLVLRIGTRVPVVLPSRVTEDLVQVLHDCSRVSPIYIMTQFNHPREIDRESIAALSRLVDAGIPLFNQTVLLRGVNDDADTLEELMNRLVSVRVKPYYLFQGDLAKGTSHFRTSLEQGFALELELRKRLSGLAMPVFAVDLPDGGGKVPLVPSRLVRQDGNRYLFESMDGREIWYSDVLI